MTQLHKEYKYIFNVINQCLVLGQEQRLGVFNKFKEIAQQIETQSIKLTDLYRYGGHHLYQQNKYIIGSFYLYLPECYDFALSSEINVDLAQKYYLLSNHPVAKWRLARLYITKRLSIKDDVLGTDEELGRLSSEHATHLIIDAITLLLNPVTEQDYFDNRLSYLVEMYLDLNHLVPDQYYPLYFDILQWIINHRQLYQPKHTQIIHPLLTLDIPRHKRRNQIIYNIVQDLLYKIV